jgi:hypothetical protein
MDVSRTANQGGGEQGRERKTILFGEVFHGRLQMFSSVDSFRYVRTAKG